MHRTQNSVSCGISPHMTETSLEPGAGLYYMYLRSFSSCLGLVHQLCPRDITVDFAPARFAFVLGAHSTNPLPRVSLYCLDPRVRVVYRKQRGALYLGFHELFVPFVQMPTRFNFPITFAAYIASNELSQAPPCLSTSKSKHSLTLSRQTETKVSTSAVCCLTHVAPSKYSKYPAFLGCTTLQFERFSLKSLAN